MYDYDNTDYDNIDFDSLRNDLINYFGSASPMYDVAFFYVSQVEEASDEELISIALDCGFDLSDYEDYGYRR